jgi:hypothetical protein
MAITATEHDILARARDDLLRAARGSRAEVVSRTAAALGCSVQTAYRKLGAAGYSSGRKRRVDAGASVALTEDELTLVAGVLRASLNQKGQRMPVRTALDMLRASGRLAREVHESTVSRQLYKRCMHPEQLALPTPSQQLRSCHPNHVWQMDSTTGAYYYLPGGRLRWMPEDQFYKNKVANLVKASSDLLTRYAVADHTSGAFKCRYYLGGETAENLLDFATWAMAKQPASPMHGVPQVLMLDKGGANRSHLMRNFCTRVGIEASFHATGAARVNGAVEKVHDLARMYFETRLRFVRPEEVNLDWLNERIEAWCAAFCATAVHSRHERTRFGVWMSIKPEQLRAPASLEALREAAVSEPQQRRVSNLKRITFGRPSREYCLRMVPGVVAGLAVTVQSNPFRAPAIDVLVLDPDTGAQSWHVVEPLVTDEFGFAADAPVIGEEFRRAGFSEVDHARNALTRQAYRTGDGLPTLEEADAARRAHRAAFEALVDPMGDIAATPVPAYLPRRATSLELPERQLAVRRISAVQACQELMRMLGEAYTPQVYAHVSSTWPDGGVPEDQLGAIADIFRPGAEPAEPRLRLASGGQS